MIPRIPVNISNAMYWLALNDEAKTAISREYPVATTTRTKAKRRTAPKRLTISLVRL
jgi:hypothetical protein